MSVLVLGLYVEGKTDELFLPLIIERTAQQILNTRRRFDVDVLPPIVLNDQIEVKPRSYWERIVEAARFAFGYDALIIHRDADRSTRSKALQQYFHPACGHIQKARNNGQQVCDKHMPIIPVREMEAWMLTDPNALKEVLHTRIDIVGLPEHASEVERIPDPKQRLNQIVKHINSKANLEDLYEPLARQISLERLGQVPAYQEFVKDMTTTLITLGMAQE